MSVPATVPTILVQIAEPDWTLRALRAALELAHERNTSITLLRLTPVHPAWLGKTSDWSLTSGKEHQLFVRCEALAKASGIPLVMRRMQYVHLKDAILEAAEHLDAEIVFATLPQTRLSWWRAQQLRQMQRQLKASSRQLDTLDQAAETA